MIKQLKEKLKRLLGTKQRRIAAGGLLGTLVIVVTILLYYRLRTKETSKKVVSRDHPSEVSRAILDQKKDRISEKKNEGTRALRGKQVKQVACDEALAALDERKKAAADLATLERLLQQVEEVCPEDKFHNARASIHSTDLSTKERVRTALNDALEKQNLNKIELEDLFQKIKTLSPTEPAPTLNDYVKKQYEELKSNEVIKSDKKEGKKLRRLLRTVTKLIPDYVDNPPLEEIVGSDEDGEIKFTAEAVADAEAQEILKSYTPNLVNPQQERRISLTKKVQEALDKRNTALKKLCEIGKSVPGEFQAEFNAWKSVGFKTSQCPEFVVFMGKSRNSIEGAVDDILHASTEYHFAEGDFLLNSRKHRTDRDDARYGQYNQAGLALILIGFKNYGIPISDTIIEWLKGEDWDQIHQLVEHLLNYDPSFECFPVFLNEAAGSEYYNAAYMLLEVHLSRFKLHNYEFTNSHNVNGYWTAVENEWQGGNGNRDYENLKYQEYKNLSEFEELENKFKGTDNHKYMDEHANIFEPVHVKLNALEFLETYKGSEAEVRSRASVLGVNPENIKESELILFEGCPKVYNLLIIKLFANKVNEIPLEQVAEVLKKQNEEFKKITLELASFNECSKFATKVREDLCSISSEGKITCTTPRWNERVNDPKWLGWILFKPTIPYEPTYLRDLLAREQDLRKRYDQGKLIHMFINDVKADSSVHPGRPTKRMHFSTRKIDFDAPKFNKKKNY